MLAARAPGRQAALPGAPRGRCYPRRAMREPPAVIGLEVHARLRTRSKLFCPCPVVDGVPPNTAVCPVCLGYPGILPVPNERAVRLGVRLALAAGARVAEVSRWDRKNYFYPDLPKGYQVTQYREPLARGGVIAGIPLERIHLEEDAARLVHEGIGEGLVGIDYNRAGVPLAEIVTAPAFREPAEAEAWLRDLRVLLRWIDVSDADPETGSLRCDVNVSLDPGDGSDGVRVEIKNLNSFRSVRRALEHEITRQRELVRAGRAVARETRGWDERAGATVAMRGKEGEADYRYLPEPDLPPLVVGRDLLEEERAALPGLPEERADRFVRELGIAPGRAKLLCRERAVADFLEATVRAGAPGPEAATWILEEIPPGDPGRLTPVALAALLGMVRAGEVARPAAREILAELRRDGGDPREIAARRGLARHADREALAGLAREAIAVRPELVAAWRRGKEGVIGPLVGDVLRASGGRADPRLAREVLRELLGPPGEERR